MTATASPLLSDEPVAPSDPYRYGWRYVQRESPDGAVTIDQVPLTLEDVLYPQVGDFIVHSRQHQEICDYLASALKAQVHGDASAVVLHDVRVAWDNPQLRPNGPDIAVFFGVREQQNWSTFDCAAEGVRPALVIEVTSPETRSTDLVNKVEIYEQAGAAQYVIIDSRRWHAVDQLHLLCYQLTSNGYGQCAVSPDGWFWMPSVRLWIAITENQVALYTEEGRRIGSYIEIDAARRSAEERASTAELRAQAEEHARAQAELRAQAEERARNQAEAQARAEQDARAQAEARAADMERRIQALEAEMRRLHGKEGA